MNPNRMKRAKTRAKERAKLRVPGRRGKPSGGGMGIGFGELLVLVLVALAVLVAVNSPSYTHREIRGGELEKQYTPEQLQNDLSLLMETLERVHPSLYRRVDRQEIIAELQRIESRLTAPMSRLEFYRLAAPMVARFGDAETEIQIPHEERDDIIDQGALLLPLEFDVTDDQVTVLYNYSSDTLVGPGSEVLGINGASIDQLRTAMLQYLSGDTEPFRLWRLGEEWRQLQWVTYGFESPFEVIVRRRNVRGGQITRTLLGVPDGVIVEAADSGILPERTRQTFDYSYQRRQAAELVVVSEMRAYPGHVASLDSMLAAAVNDGANSLVIDLRGTPGGDLIAAENWLKKLLAGPEVLVDGREVRVSKEARLWYTRDLPLIQRWYPPLFSEELARIWRAPLESYEHLEGEVTVVPDGNAFTGDLFLLIDDQTGPAAVALATVLQRTNRAQILGMEAAPGAYFYGEPYGFDLPNSRLRITCPIERLVVTGAQSGVQPDLVVEPTALERRRNLDSGLVRALNIAEQSRR